MESVPVKANQQCGIIAAPPTSVFQEAGTSSRKSQNRLESRDIRPFICHRRATLFVAVAVWSVRLLSGLDAPLNPGKLDISQRGKLKPLPECARDTVHV